MPDNESKAEGRARRTRQFKEIEDSLAHATDLIDQSKREVARSRQIMKDSEAADDKAEQDRVKARKRGTSRSS